MTSIKKITKEVFQTTDGIQFETSTEALKHQEHLDAPKVYLLWSQFSICDDVLESIFSTESAANMELKRLKAESDIDIDYGCVETHYRIEPRLLKS